MSNEVTNHTLAHPFWPVNDGLPQPWCNSSGSMIHHKVEPQKRLTERIVYRGDMERRYGVSPSRRVLTRGLLLKKFDYIRDCLRTCLGLSCAERETTIRLLRYWVYYGRVYPKESQVTSEPGCSKATFWRTVRVLKDLGLITVVNRFLIRPHAQISNLYYLDKLLILIAKYLSERIAYVWPEWLMPHLELPWPEVCPLFQLPERRMLFYSSAG